MSELCKISVLFLTLQLVRVTRRPIGVKHVKSLAIATSNLGSGGTNVMGDRGATNAEAADDSGKLMDT